VLPIGGLKEKALAAHRGGIIKILIPKENEKDIEEIPPTVRASLEIVPVTHVDQVLFEALVCRELDAFDKLLDKKLMRDDLLFSELGQKSKAEDDVSIVDKVKDSSSGIVTH